MNTPSATSLPRAPRDDSSARFRNYVILMSVRIACFVLMVLITPYGWYTWILGIGAVFLPYIAVMIANVGSAPPPAAAETPALALPATPSADSQQPGVHVIRITEATPPQSLERDPHADAPSTEPSDEEPPAAEGTTS